MKTKICKNCNIEKELGEFSKDKSRKDGVFPYCKKCHNEIAKKIYQDKRSEKIEYQKQYYKNHKQEKQEYDKKRRNLQSVKDKRNTKHCIRYRNDDIYYLKYTLKNLLYKIKSGMKYTKNNKIYNVLQCDYDTFIKHLSDTYFINYGIECDNIKDTHIDHIIPLYLANTKEEVIKLFNYKNLQLLKPKDNLLKGKNYGGN